MMNETACSRRNGLHRQNDDMKVFDFNETDSKPFRDKDSRIALFQKSFTSKARKPVKRRSLSVISGKPNKRRAQSKNTKQHCTRNSPCQRDAAGQEALSGSPASDEIESDSDSVSEEKLPKSSHLKTEGVLKPSVTTMGACLDKEHVAEKVTEVIVPAEVLLSNNFHISSPCFTFMIDAIILSRSNDHSDHCIIKWPLCEIKSFGSYRSEQAGCDLLELSLTEFGAERLKKMLEKSNVCDKDDLLSSASVCLQAKICDVNWSEKERKITSLSDGYKSLWRPLKVKVKAEHVSGCMEGFQKSTARATDDSERLHGWVDIVYPKGDHDAVTVTENDFKLLNPGEFLSDTIIDFYIKHLQSTLSEHNKKQFYFFNSFFYRKLTEIDKGLLYGSEKWKSAFERVKRWTTKVNIFEKDYLFIPIMQSAHWSLIIICHPGHILTDCEERSTSNVPMIFHCDSLKGCHAGLEEPIRQYLMEAWIQRCGFSGGYNSNMFSEVKFISAQVPQQTNYSDCGLFLLHYVEAFIKDIQIGGLPNFLTGEWFNPEDASNKRVDIQRLLMGIHDKELADRGVALKTVQDRFSLDVNNGVNIVGVLEGDGMRNKDLTCVSKDFERMNMTHEHSAEQMSGAVLGLLHHETKLCNTCDRVQQKDLIVDTDHSTSQGVMEAFHCHHNSCCIPPQDSSGSLQAAKGSIDHSIVEEDLNTLKSVSVDSVFEDVNPHALNASFHGNSESVHVCHVRTLCDDPVQKADDFPNEISSIDVLRCGNDGMQDNSKQMVIKEMCSGSAIEKVGQSPVGSRQLGSAKEYEFKNMSLCMSKVEEGFQNVKTIFDTYKETAKCHTFQETTAQDSSRSLSYCSPSREVVCSNRATIYKSHDKVWVERDPNDVTMFDKVDIHQATDPGSIISIQGSSCQLEDENLCHENAEGMHDISKPSVQETSSLASAQYISSDEESSPVYQPGLNCEVENMIKAVKMRKQSRASKMTDDSRRRPVTRSATNKMEYTLQQQGKRKLLIELT